MPDSWINDAMKKAAQEAESAQPILNRCYVHLEKLTPGMLDIWSNNIGQKQMLKLTLLMSDEDFKNALIELSKVFFLGGYSAALEDVSNGDIEV